MRVLGVDFTSAPRRAKPIVVAVGRLDTNPENAAGVELEALHACCDWAAFETLLETPGPWVGGFDLPFGLPRAAVLELGWPDTWPALVRHCARLGKTGFRAQLDALRERQPPGRRYHHRSTDSPAGSHSPLKLVNPPVGLMFLEGAPRLLAAGLSLPGLHAGDPTRIAIEAYPGLLARAITRDSYKSDERAKQTPARRATRCQLVDTLRSGAHPLALRLTGSAADLESLIEDPGGDRLDAVLAMLQAAWCAQAGPPHYGLPAGMDALEGWIATAPHV